MKRREFIKSSGGIALGTALSGCVVNEKSRDNRVDREDFEYTESIDYVDSVSNELLYEIFDNPSKIELVKINVRERNADVQTRKIAFGERKEEPGFSQAFPDQNTSQVLTNTDFVKDPSTRNLGCENCGQSRFEDWDKDIHLNKFATKGFLSSGGIREMREHNGGIFYDTFQQMNVEFNTVEINTFRIGEQDWHDNGTKEYMGVETREYISEDGEILNLYMKEDTKNNIVLHADLNDYKLEINEIQEEYADINLQPEWFKDFDEFVHRMKGYRYKINGSSLILEGFPNPLPNCHIKYEDSDTSETLKNGTISPTDPLYLTDDGLKQQRYLKEDESISGAKEFEYGSSIEIIDPRSGETLDKFTIDKDRENELIGRWLDPEYKVELSEDIIQVKIYSVVKFDDFEVEIGDQKRKVSTKDGDYDGRGPYRPYIFQFDRPKDNDFNIIYRNLEEDREVTLK